MFREKYFLVFFLIVFLACSTWSIDGFVFAQTRMELPLLNPLGSGLEKYSYDNRLRIFELKYLAEDGSPRKTKIFADYWRLWVSVEDDNEDPLDHMRDYLKEVEAKILYNSDRRLICKLPGTNSETWWGDAEITASDQYYLKVYREKRLEAGETYTFTIDNNGFDFSFLNKGSHYITAHLYLPSDHPDAKFSLFIYTERDKNGQNVIMNRVRLNTEMTDYYCLDEIPQLPGLSTWQLQVKDVDSPVEISIRIEETTKLPETIFKAEYGGLRVRGLDFKSAEVEPLSTIEPAVETSYGNGETDYDIPVNFKADRTPEGDALFCLPAGMWNLKIVPKDFDIQSFNARLLPVNPGEMTIVDLPAAVTAAASEARGGLYINKIVENNDKVAVTFNFLDRSANEIEPSIDNMGVVEGGMTASISRVEQLHTPANLVLILDSSGSMKGQMKETIVVAEKFISSLSDDTIVQVVDFDTRPKLLSANSKKEVLEKLKNVKADGATALYDTTLTGLDLLRDKERPAILLFTDGMDANFDDSGPGSKASYEEVLAAVKKADIPLYTIGFGPNHDNETLIRLAEVSGGSYYPAVDPDGLDKVFAAIEENIGKTYQLTYQRPDKAALSDIPVVSLVLDKSGSMSLPPEREGCAYRLQKVKNLLHDLILQLPERCLIQFQTFDHRLRVDQVFTNNKAELLSALGYITRGGGTDILGSSRLAYETMRNVPSTNKIVIYITDAALDVEDDDRQEFYTLLKKYKDHDIKALWVGIGMEEAEEAFIRAAEFSGGDYVITEDMNVLKKAFDELIHKELLNSRQQNKIPLRLTLKERFFSGEVKTYTASKLVELSEPPVVDKELVPESVSYQTGLPFSHFDMDISRLLSDTDIPGREVLINKRIPLDLSNTNQAMNLKAVEAIIFKRLANVSAPHGYQFLGLDLKLNNILPVQEVLVYPDGGSHPASWVNSGIPAGAKKVKMQPTYVIPNLKSHLFIRINNAVSYPVSPVTWLAEKPLIDPGENKVILEADELINGLCIFLVPDEPLEQASLHFYDIAYGHMVLPLIGKANLNYEELILDELPETPPVDLSETFSITLNSVKDLDSIGGVEAGHESVFRVIEADLTSRLQAILNIEAEKVFKLRVLTDKGYVYLPLHPVTGLLPFGLTEQIMVVPGSLNKIRLAFQIPTYLADKLQGDLLLRLKGDDLIVPIANEEEINIANNNQEISNLDLKQDYLFSSDGIDLLINEVTYYPGKNNLVLADITLLDQADGYATSLQDVLMLIRDDYEVARENTFGSGKVLDNQAERKGLDAFSENQGVEYLLKADAITDELLFGYSNENVVYDGTNRRGIVVFRIPNSGRNHGWFLRSNYFPELKIPVSKEAYSTRDFLLRKVSDKTTIEHEKYKNHLSEALTQVIKRYRISKAAVQNDMGSKEKSETKIDLDGDKTIQEIPVPPLTLAGMNKYKSIRTMEDMKSIIRDIRWLPSDGPWNIRFAPEAVLTQNWGTEADIAYMVEKLLVRLGYRPERAVLELTKEGQKELESLENLTGIRTERVPAIIYMDDSKLERVFVLPFMKDLSELEGLVKVPDERIIPDITRKMDARINVYFKLISTESVDERQSQMADIGAILGGTEELEEIEEHQIFSEEIPLMELSKGAVDLAYIIQGHDKGDLYTVALETAEKKYIGDKYRAVDTGLYRIMGVKVYIELPYGQRFTREISLKEGETIDGLFHTMAINQPDINGKMSEDLVETANQISDSIDNPELLSSLRWYTRSILSKFIISQSALERDLASKLNLTVGRTHEFRCIFLTIRAGKDINLESSIDLIQCHNQIHKGEPEAVYAFNIISGLFASKLESEVLAGKKLGLFEIWKQLPEDAAFVIIDDKKDQEIIDFMENNNYPESVIEAISDTEDMVIIPDRAALIKGEERWAYLKINPDNYQTISVLDDGTHGTSSSYALAEKLQDKMIYQIGQFVGLDAALLAVNSFSLTTDDYDEVLRQSEEFALSVADTISEKFNLPGSSDLYDNVPSKSFQSARSTISTRTKNFTEGFTKAVQLYFELVRLTKDI